MKKLMHALCAASAFALATAAGATVTVNGDKLTQGTPDTINFGGPAGSGATSSLTLTLDTFSALTGTYSFLYSFSTTGNTSIANLTGFGFTTDPTLLSVSGTGLDFVLNPINFPGGFDVDACGTVNSGQQGNHCDAANGQGDLFNGAFTLDFADGTSTISLDNLVVRYASLTNLGGISGEGTPVGPPPPPPPPAVPEPATWAMMLIGFGAVGFQIRRRRASTLAQLA